jgi:hypothetical protein
MSLAELRVEPDRSSRCRDGAVEQIADGGGAVPPAEDSRIGQPGPRPREPRVAGYRGLEVRDCPPNRFRRAFAPVMPPLQVQIVGGGISGVSGGNLPSFRGGQSHSQLRRDLARDLVFDVEDVG